MTQSSSDVANPVASLKGRRVFLRSVYAEDYPYLRHLEFDLDDSVLYRHRGVSVAPEQYASSLWAGVLCQFMVCAIDDGHPVGIVSAFAADLRARHARIAFLTDPVVRKLGWPAEGIVLFIDFLFKTFSFHKLYADVLRPNAEAFSAGISALIQLEGEFRDHDVVNGEFVDFLTFAIYRDSWAEYVESRVSTLINLAASRE